MPKKRHSPFYFPAEFFRLTFEIFCGKLSVKCEKETAVKNTRFPVKSGNLDYAALEALIKFYENGGKIKVAPKTKRPVRGYTVGKESKSLRG